MNSVVEHCPCRRDKQEPPCRVGMEVERYLMDFIFAHTGEEAELHLVRDIQVRHASRKGHTMLAVLWANALQHELNYPQSKHIYTQAFDEAIGSDVLVVTADDVQMMVYMSSGTLRIAGQYVYEWFAKHFRQILENFDPVFAAKWEDPGNGVKKAEARTKVSRTRIRENKKEMRTLKDHRTATEEYLLLLTNRHIHHNGHNKRIMQDTRHLDLELSRMSLVQQFIWRGADLPDQVSTLRGGAVKDGYNYIYKLWRSLLCSWFSCRNTRVFLCSPCLDERCLADILDLYLPHSTTAELVSIFTQRKCNDETKNQNSFFEMKRKLLKKYPERSHSVIEYKVYKALLYPRKFNCRFIASIRDGEAQVMVTSANFNMDHFVSGNMEFVSVMNMSEKTFMRDYITPLTDQSIVLDSYDY